MLLISVSVRDKGCIDAPGMKAAIETVKLFIDISVFTQKWQFFWS